MSVILGSRQEYIRTCDIPRICVQCQLEFRARNGHAKTCSKKCAKIRKLEQARKRTARCEWCNQWCRGRFCSGDCQHRHEESLTYGGSPTAERAKMKARYGAPIAGPFPAPECHCGKPLRYGSDSMTGRSTQFCPTHGESWLQTYRRQVA